VRAIGGWLVTPDTTDQIGHLVIKPVRQDGIRMLGDGIADDPRFRDARKSSGFFEPCLSSGV
jgi:hypothetical protein